MDQLKARLEQALNEDILTIKLSNRKNSQHRFLKTAVRKITLKGRKVYQIERFEKEKVFHENIEPDALFDALYELMRNDYRQCVMLTQDSEISIKTAKSGSVLFRKKKREYADAAKPEHDRNKNYLLKEGEYIPALYDLGIISSDGKIVAAKYDKFKQINRFLEMIDDIVTKDSREDYSIIDFGCGKSYLTFILYHYMTKIAGKKVKITGLDQKREVMENCAALAVKYGYENLVFRCGDIRAFHAEQRPDMVISLHACDIATDYAIYHAYRWQADYILSVPCCQHEMNRTIHTDKLGLLTEHGIIQERFCAISTDAIRAALLESCGYHADVMEFIDFTHSPKNLLIRASKKKSAPFAKRQAALKRVDDFFTLFRASHTLYGLVVKRRPYRCRDKEFLCVTGYASMLYSDSAYIRREVFVKEQNVPQGNEYDEKDKVAAFVVIYDGGKPVATGRIYPRGENGEYKLGRIAVLRHMRGLGLGGAVTQELERFLTENGGKTAYLFAQTHAVGFYKKQGYTEYGEEFLEENIPHFAMIKEF